MALSWNEIKRRAVEFSKEWENETNENAEAKTFLDQFFNVFGITRRRVTTFEKRVKKLDGKDGYIDALWKGQILIEQKSKGQNLDRAHKQATDYFSGLKEEDLPKYILVSDFSKFRLYDLETGEQHEFELKDLYKNIKLFAFIAGYQKTEYKEEDPVNVEAANLMAKLHDKMKEVGYKGHELEVYLVRILFCLFADDTTIFEKNSFQDFLRNKTKEDGSDLAPHFALLFQVLNTPKEERLTNLDEDLNAFEYVNGKLFEEPLPVASFDKAMRDILFECCKLNWSLISPAIFGSMFQSIVDPKERRNLGQHYTSEKNILKLIKPLFLDELYKEFEKIKDNTNRLTEFHTKISSLKFLDPACGCGNFLVITYRELRLLEIEIIKILQKGQQVTSIDPFIRIEVDKFYGIEYEEFPVRIAEVAMWLIDHQMNMRVSEEFGLYYARLPLKKSANIKHGNALRLDWNTMVPNTELNYILGNPPFGGKQLQNDEQKADMDIIFSDISNAGVLDYVTSWYIKSAQYIQNTQVKVGFVSTNSITQGEQVGILWNELLNRYKIKIHFAHKTFKWSNEGRGIAGVYCVIIGFGIIDIKDKKLYEYEDVKSEPHEIKVSNINPYLVDADDIVIMNRQNPISNVPEIVFGNMPNDGGNFLFTDEEKIIFLKKEPLANKFMKPLISAKEFLNGEKRWCLWLKNISPAELRKLPEVGDRVERVKKYRLASQRATTRKLANYPNLFGEIRQPESDFVFIPLTSSEHRRFIPIAFFDKNNIVNNTCSIIENATKYHFGILTSTMHMSWVRYVCGRLESRYRYSNKLVYNNYPWPENPSAKNTKLVEEKAQKVLDVRNEFPESSLADLYDPIAMPPKLVKAHQELDRAVDLCYRPQEFTTELNRLEFLFELYKKYTSPMFSVKKAKKPKKLLNL